MSLTKIMGLYMNPRKDLWTQKELKVIKIAFECMIHYKWSYYFTCNHFKKYDLKNRSFHAIRAKLRIEMEKWRKDNHYP